MMVWLYKGMYAVNNNPNIKDIYLNFPLKMLTILKENGIKCIAVFDGNLLPEHIHELTEKTDGEYPWDILTAADGARLEMDVGPVLESGRDPAAELAKMKGRLPGGIHAKPVGATAVGAPGDRQDWPKVVAAAERAGVKWLVLECEKRQDTFEDVADSAKFMRPLVSLVNALR